MIFLATGTAIFKPGIQGTLGHVLPHGKSSTGWGAFYWLVNVGAMIGPPLAGFLRAMSWSYVFYGCAAIVSLNYLMLFTYQDPESGYAKKDSVTDVMIVTLKNLMNGRLIVVLSILAGFWLMMYQLWDLAPNFIADWVDTRDILGMFPEAWTHVPADDRGRQVLQENVLNFNAFLIVLLIIPLSMLVRKMKTLVAMLIGMIIATLGIITSGTNTGWFLLLAIFLFSAGEMLTGPKKLELFDLIAPPGKKALYLGYVNVPVGVGWLVGSLISGYLYGNFGEKAILSLKYLAEKTEYLANNGLAAWNGDVATLEATVGVKRSGAFQALMEHMKLNGTDATQLLWDTYSPQQVWYQLAGIGVASIIALFFFIRWVRRTGDMDV